MLHATYINATLKEVIAVSAQMVKEIRVIVIYLPMILVIMSAYLIIVVLTTMREIVNFVIQIKPAIDI